MIWADVGPWEGFHMRTDPSHPPEKVVIPSYTDLSKYLKQEEKKTKKKK